MLAIGLQIAVESDKATDGGRRTVDELVLSYGFYSSPSNAFALGRWLGLLGLAGMLL